MILSEGNTYPTLDGSLTIYTASTHPNLIPTIKHILEHALSIAKNRGLLSNVANPSLGNPTNNRAQSSQITFNELIPLGDRIYMQCKQIIPLLMVFLLLISRHVSSTLPLTGRKVSLNLLIYTQLDQQEVSSALRFLLKQKHIQLHDPNGKAIDSSQFFELL